MQDVVLDILNANDPNGIIASSVIYTNSEIASYIGIELPNTISNANINKGQIDGVSLTYNSFILSNNTDSNTFNLDGFKPSNNAASLQDYSILNFNKNCSFNDITLATTTSTTSSSNNGFSAAIYENGSYQKVIDDTNGNSLFLHFELLYNNVPFNFQPSSIS
ncbi:hypothetical protein J6P52_01390 [bacterium]|nr:hypothetical protein [bacterium]